MNPLKIIIRFTYSHEVPVAKALLEAEDIECVIQDEVTIGAHPFYSNAIGGIKLLVHENDVELATQILTEGGFIKPESKKEHHLITWFTTKTSGLPWIGKKTPEIRFVFLLGLISLLIILPVFLLTRPSSYQLLTKKTWCLDHIIHQGNFYFPHSDEIVTHPDNSCDEWIMFDEDGSVSIPGFSCYRFTGRYVYDRKRLVITKTDEYGYVFENTYKLIIDESSLVLKSGKTSIHCYNNDPGY
ncbi:MAG: DUF2007 domain-containing protein [Flavobacteriales bacterium]